MITYEWIVEKLDEFGDIQDISPSDTYAQALRYRDFYRNEGAEEIEVGLVRNRWNDIDEDLEDRQWAYLDEDGKLPDKFGWRSRSPKKVFPGGRSRESTHRRSGRVETMTKQKFSRFNQPIACRMCGKSTTWSEVNGNSGLELCRACFEKATLENEHYDGYHEQPHANCQLCIQGQKEGAL